METPRILEAFQKLMQTDFSIKKAIETLLLILRVIMSFTLGTINPAWT